MSAGDLVALVQARLKAWPTEFRSIEGAASLTELTARGILPQHTPAAWVLPLGEEAGAQQAGTMVTRQRLTETVAVVVAVRAADRLREAGRDQATVLRDQVRAALLGWVPGGPWTPMVFRRSRLSGLQGGAITYTAEYQSSHTITGPVAPPEPEPEP